MACHVALPFGPLLLFPDSSPSPAFSLTMAKILSKLQNQFPGPQEALLDCQ